MLTEKDISCSDLARQHAVPLIGSATRGDIWFLLEYAGRWEAKAFEQADLPQSVKEHLLDAAARAGHGRILLIRQPASQQRTRLNFFIAQVDPQDPRLYTYRFNDPTDLLEIDLAAYAEGQPGPATHLTQDPLYLVCTNGLRDACCARFGPQLFAALTAEAGETVWQSSHIGGHNKAPVLLYLPQGLLYGRLSPVEIPQLLEAHRQKQVWLPYYRGRVCYEPPVQAAEHFWRQRQVDFTLPGPHLGPAEALGEQRWQVPVLDPVAGQPLEYILVQLQRSPEQIATTCAGNKFAPIETFREIQDQESG